MITVSSFCCPCCNTAGRPVVVAIGTDFSYKCQACNAVHCFLENLYWDFTDNFKPPRLSRYAGTVDASYSCWVDTELFEKDRVAIERLQIGFTQILLNKQQTQAADSAVLQFKLSRKSVNGRTVYLANAACNSHFQECFRGVVRMQEHLWQAKAIDTYNILMVNDHTRIFEKGLAGLDEMWVLPEIPTKVGYCYVSEMPDDFEQAVQLSLQLDRLLSGYSNSSYVISKCGFAAARSREAVLSLLNGLKNITLIDNQQRALEKKYVAVLVRNNGHERAGFDSKPAITAAMACVVNCGFQPLVVSCTNAERQLCSKLDIPFVHLASLREQVCFYRNFCAGVICGAGSCCNVPCAYGLPVLAFSKSRFWPNNDFYCFARLLSPYDSDKIFGGKLTKPDNVIEVQVPATCTDFVTTFQGLTKEWLRQYCTN